MIMWHQQFGSTVYFHGVKGFPPAEYDSFASPWAAKFPLRRGPPLAPVPSTTPVAGRRKIIFKKSPPSNDVTTLPGKIWKWQQSTAGITRKIYDFNKVMLSPTMPTISPPPPVSHWLPGHTRDTVTQELDSHWPHSTFSSAEMAAPHR